MTRPEFLEHVERKVVTLDITSVSKDLETDVSTLELIITAFKQKSYEDNIITFSRPVYSLAVQTSEQLVAGTTLTGKFLYCYPNYVFVF